MAKLVQAVQRYGPRLVANRAARLDEVAEWLAGRSGLTRGQVLIVLMEMSAAVSYFNRGGSAVKLPGLGLFTPIIRGNGQLRIGYRPDPALKREMNADSAYRGDMRNRENIGLDAAGFKALWDAEFPGDPVDLNEPT